jgi:hypothetical protein
MFFLVLNFYHSFKLKFNQFELESHSIFLKIQIQLLRFILFSYFHLIGYFQYFILISILAIVVYFAS